jgi:hypothetical protein
MGKTYAIVPGRSIGPFELGMTREEIEALGIQPGKPLADNKGVYYPLVDMDEEALRKASYPRPGVNVTFDESGRCHRIEAILSYDATPPVFTLYGSVANGMTAGAVASILREIATDVRFFYASVHSASAGLQATKWEASDDHIMSIQIRPKEAKR